MNKHELISASSLVPGNLFMYPTSNHLRCLISALCEKKRRRLICLDYLGNIIEVCVLENTKYVRIQ